MSTTHTLLLAIEAAVDGGSVSLVRNGDEIASWTGRGILSRSEDLLPAIDRLLRENSISRDAITLVAASSGPGSFTGIRIGLSTAMGLARGIDRPLTTANILQAVAGAAARPGPVTACVPMGRSAVCVQVFDDPLNDGVPLTEAATVPEAEFLRLIDQNPETIFASLGSLSTLIADLPNYVDLRMPLATALALWCERRPPVVEPPIFVAKSF